MRLWWIEAQDADFLLVFHHVMVSVFKFGGNRRFFGADTANFMWCREGARAIPVPVASQFPVAYVSDCLSYKNTPCLSLTRLVLIFCKCPLFL